MKQYWNAQNALRPLPATTEKGFALIMEKFGLPNDEEGRKQLHYLNPNLYVPEKDYQQWKKELADIKAEIVRQNKNPDFFRGAVRYEFYNQEYHYSDDDKNILDALGLTVEEVNENEELCKIYNEERRKFLVAMGEIA